MNFFRTTDTTDTTIWKPGLTIQHRYVFFRFSANNLPSSQVGLDSCYIREFKKRQQQQCVTSMIWLVEREKNNRAARAGSESFSLCLYMKTMCYSSERTTFAHFAPTWDNRNTFKLRLSSILRWHFRCKSFSNSLLKRHNRQEVRFMAQTRFRLLIWNTLFGQCLAFLPEGFIRNWVDNRATVTKKFPKTRKPRFVFNRSG